MSELDRELKQRLVATLHDLSDVAGPAILPFFRSPLTVDNKAAETGFDPVTEADRAAERAIVACLSERFPDHAILGEEFGRQGGSSDLEWVIDPIDGTRAFICGAPTWGTLIGLRSSAGVHFGVMDQPFTGERFWRGVDGSFARRPDGSVKPLQTNKACTELSDALISTTAPELFDDEAAAGFAAIKRTAKSIRYGMDCYAYCLLAGGTLDLVIESGLHAYDIVALIPIIEGAGGVVTTWTGGDARDGGSVLATGNPALHENALNTLTKAIA